MMKTPRERFHSLLDVRELLFSLIYSESVSSQVRQESHRLLASYPLAEEIHMLAAREELLIELKPRLAKGRIIAAELPPSDEVEVHPQLKK